MAPGAIMLDLAGESLTAEDREILLHPQVGGVILFSRNYHAPAQLRALVDSIHALRTPPLLVAVDHEGGRVQRFREGFTTLPPARWLGQRHDLNPHEAEALAADVGWLLATELRACGVDLSFAPVLDLDHGLSSVIGDRAFHADPDVVTRLARASIRGMLAAGMASVGKHFPGHGGVTLDSHHSLPVDHRSLADLALADLIPFERLARSGLAGIMPAHVLYPAVDSQPAGFSRRWITEILRGDLGFQGAVFSDDLDMAGAAVAGAPLDRAHAALAAGCDMLLVCNNRPAAISVVEGLKEPIQPASFARLIRMHGRSGRDSGLAHQASEARRAAISALLVLET